MQKSALNKFDGIENSNTEEERRFSSLDSPAGIRGGRFCNFDCKLFRKLQKPEVRSAKFPCLQRESLSSDITFLTIREEGGKGEKGKKEARAALTRSNSARKHRRNHLRPACLFNSAGRRRFVCARHTKFQPGERTHTNAFTRFSEL